ncbi:MAG: HAD family hydrolase [Candidatus Bathyarchaeia archaeon]
MRIKAVLLDFGDTLVGFERFDYDACLRELHGALLRDGVALPYEDFKRVYFEVRDRLYRETEDSLEEHNFCLRVSEALKRFGHTFDPSDHSIVSAVEAFMRLLIDSVAMDKQVPAVLKLLNQRYKLALVSNFGYPQTIIQLLNKFDLIGFFDAICVSGQVGWRKPSPKIFQKALNALGVAPSEAVFVGDAPYHDIQGAKRMGMKTVLVKKGSAEGDVNSGSPDKIISGIEELPQTLSEL